LVPSCFCPGLPTLAAHASPTKSRAEPAFAKHPDGSTISGSLGQFGVGANNPFEQKRERYTVALILHLY
jgi:hypothetical protein